MTNNTDTARQFIEENSLISYGSVEIEFTAKLMVKYASKFTPAIESGHDFLERKLKGGWRLEASDMTNCLAALLDEYGQRTPAPIGDEEIEVKAKEIHEANSSLLSMFPRQVAALLKLSFQDGAKWYRSALAQAKKEGE